MDIVTTPLGDLLGRYAGEKAADAPALIYPDGAVSWAELDKRANRRARLYRSLGVGKDDKVAIALPNGVRFHETTFAVWKLGATPTILSPRLPEREFDAIIDLVEPKLTLGGPLKVDDGSQTPPEDEDASGFDDGPLTGEVAPYWKAICSGGSTGQPKVIVDHMPGAFDPDVPGPQTLLMLPKDGVMLNPGPLYHNGPFMFTSLALFTGATVVGMERFDPKEALRLIEAHGVNWVCLVPAMMHRIWSLPPRVRERYDLSSLRTVWHMAAPCPAWLKQAWIDWLGPDRIWEAYAGTEGFGNTVIRGSEWLERRGSVGRLVGGGKIKAVGEDGSDCAPGEVGELFFLPAGSAPPSHYLGAEPVRDAQGWLSIGDLGSIDEDGYVYLADRRTDLIIRGGANVYPAEVEAALDEHPSIASSIVIGLPCEEMGAQVHAIIEPAQNVEPDLNDLRDFLSARLTRYKLPHSYEVLHEPLRDEAGKARRAALREKRLEWLREGVPFKAG